MIFSWKKSSKFVFVPSNMPKRRENELKCTEFEDNSGEETGVLGKVRKEEQRVAANRRERTRMRVLSKAFIKLKTTLPWVPLDTKLSKLDTLRLASSYIGHLNQMLIGGDDINTQLNFCPENLTWPLLFDSRAMGNVIRKGQSGSDSGDGQSS